MQSTWQFPQYPRNQVSATLGNDANTVTVGVPRKKLCDPNGSEHDLNSCRVNGRRWCLVRASKRKQPMTVFDIDSRLALPCDTVIVSHFLCVFATGCRSAITNVAVTPAAEQSMQCYSRTQYIRATGSELKMHYQTVYFRLVGVLPPRPSWGC